MICDLVILRPYRVLQMLSAEYNIKTLSCVAFAYELCLITDYTSEFFFPWVNCLSQQTKHNLPGYVVFIRRIEAQFFLVPN